MPLTDMADFQRKIHDFKMDITGHLEMMAAAYMKATNIPPEECELVVETLPDKVIYRFQRRRTKIALDVDCTHAYSHDTQPADYKFCPWCGRQHNQRQ